MLALIKIPHQLPARIYWYRDEDRTIDEAIEQGYDDWAADSSDPRGDDYDVSFDDAIAFLSDDWHGYLLIRSEADIDNARNYSGHQLHKVRAMVAELEQEMRDTSKDEEYDEDSYENF